MSIFLRSRVLSGWVLVACALASATQAAPLLPSMPDAAFHDYLLSPRFAEVLRAGVGRVAGCDAPARLRWLELRALQPVAMDAAPHPVEGLWRVRVEAEACGRLTEHALFFAADAGRPPRVTRQR